MFVVFMDVLLSHSFSVSNTVANRFRFFQKNEYKSTVSFLRPATN